MCRIFPSCREIPGENPEELQGYPPYRRCPGFDRNVGSHETIEDRCPRERNSRKHTHALYYQRHSYSERCAGCVTTCGIDNRPILGLCLVRESIKSGNIDFGISCTPYVRRHALFSAANGHRLPGGCPGSEFQYLAV